MRKRGFVLVWLAGIALATLGLRACTAGIARQNVNGIGEVTSVVDGARPGEVVVHTHTQGYVRDLAWVVTDDGDVTSMEGEGAETPGGPRAQGCAGDACYRAAGDALRVEGSGDGGRTWATAWEVTGPAYAELVRTYPKLGDPAEHLASRSVVVHAVAGGHVVYVANGRDGLLRRDPGGAWRRIGSPDSGEGCCFLDPVPRLATDPPSPDPAPYAAGFVALGVLAAGAVASARRRSWRPPALLAVAALAALGGCVAYLGAGMPDVGMFPGLFYGAPLVLGALAGGAVLAAAFVRRAAPARPSGADVDVPGPEAGVARLGGGEGGGGLA